MIPHHAILLLILFHLLPTLINGQASFGCPNYGWTQRDGQCYKPFIYYVNDAEGAQLCAKLGASMVATIGQLPADLAPLVHEEQRMVQLLGLGQPGKHNGVMCQKAAGNVPNDLFDSVCPGEAAKWPAPTPNRYNPYPAAGGGSNGAGNIPTNGPDAPGSTSGGSGNAPGNAGGDAHPPGLPSDSDDGDLPPGSGSESYRRPMAN